MSIPNEKLLVGLLEFTKERVVTEDLGPKVGQRLTVAKCHIVAPEGFEYSSVSWEKNDTLIP